MWSVVLLFGLEYIDAGDVSILKKKDAAAKLMIANQKAAML